MIASSDQFFGVGLLSRLPNASSGSILEIMASSSHVSSHLRYKDKVAIVTGGSKGIGEGCVRVFGKF